VRSPRRQLHEPATHSFPVQFTKGLRTTAVRDHLSPSPKVDFELISEENFEMLRSKTRAPIYTAT